MGPYATENPAEFAAVSEESYGGPEQTMAALINNYACTIGRTLGNVFITTGHCKLKPLPDLATRLIVH